MKYVLLTLAIAIAFLMVVRTSFAAPLTLPFGGKVTNTINPSLVCKPVPGPVYTYTGKALDVANNLVPLYANDVRKMPRVGGYILGRYSVIPNMTYCNTLKGDPYPVKAFTIYGISR
jgi:hypothetical protein